MTPEQLKLVGLVIERAEQACRYALKHQNHDSETNPEYRSGWEVAASVCEGAIKSSVMRHIEDDWRELEGTMADGSNFLAWLCEDICTVTAKPNTPRDEQLKEYAEKGFLKFSSCVHGTNYYEITSKWMREAR